MKVREVIRMIEEDGRFIVRTKGSHRQFKNETKPGLVTIQESWAMSLLRVL
jgi:predicted RNA binding protein YcfA (HicA-like mRNA interferase family)